MITWLLGGYAVFVASMAGTACFVALFGDDRTRRDSGFKVLKLVWISVAGAGGVMMLALKLGGLGLV
ncbi:hypothetical protein [Lentzea albidocapillata]|uniref:hypothetical protein n=1 Tax=Lentzea albidocapillata TaxID=40571 RepID=UPI001182FE48|nr:hypothetical protein [Lentzea albidocapillata]